MIESDRLMSTLASDAATIQGLLCCPTCGARQPPADQCRRCQSDLTLLRAALDEHDRLRNLCLCELRQRLIGRATRTAQRCYELWPCPDNARLLATCFLMQGRFAQALGLYLTTPPSSEALT